MCSPELRKPSRLRAGDRAPDPPCVDGNGAARRLFEISSCRGVWATVFRHDIKNVHQSELLLIYFTDGWIMGIDTGSNAANLRHKPSQPEDFHVDFCMNWVPPAL